MAKTVGVVMTERIVASVIEGHKVAGELRHYPEKQDDEGESGEALIEMPADSLWDLICDQIAALAPAGSGVEAVGVAMPGMIRKRPQLRRRPH